MPHTVVPRSVVCLCLALLLVGLSPVPPPAPAAPPPPEEGRDSPAVALLYVGAHLALAGAVLVGAAVSSKDDKSEKDTDEGETKTGGEGTDPDTDSDEETERGSTESSRVIVPLGADAGVPLTRDDTGPWYQFAHEGTATAGTTEAEITYASISASADVLQTKEDVREVSYLQEQTHTFRVERTSRRGPAEAQLALTIEEVRLSTIDIPDTYGHSILTMSVSVAGREVYSATASVAQAQEPVVSEDFTYESIEAKPDLLVLRGVEQTLDLKLPMKRTFDIAVTFRFEGVGQRL